MADDYAGNSSTTGSVSLGGAVGGTIEVLGDKDWFAVSLVSGQTYTFSLSAASSGGLADPYLRLYDSSGTYITYNDDDDFGLNSLLTFQATYTGTYYLEAAAYIDGYTGAYVLSSDTTAPVVQSFSPADEATSVGVGVNIILTFSEAIERGIGTIYLKTAAGAIVEAFDAATSNRLSIFGSTLTIDPTANLLNSTGYRVEFAAGSIRDIAGNHYAGTTSYNFTTVAAAPFNGTSGDDHIPGSGGDDTIFGFAGNDTLEGLAGNDSIDGGPGNDWIDGGAGNDTLDGGAGIDVVSYQTSPTGVHVDLAAGTAQDGVGGNDTLVGIENVSGSSFGDLINGNAGDNWLSGGVGNDNLSGAGGNDALFGNEGSDALSGGTGNDTLDGGAILDRINYTDLNSVSYSSSTSAVNVNFATGVALDGFGGTDTLIDIDFVTGSNFNDTFTGSSGPLFEQFEGGLGDDTIDGGAIDGTTNLNSNRVSYQNSPSAISADLATGHVTGGSGNDTLININFVRATNSADVLLGSNTTAYTEIFEGRGGNDTIDGLGGIDQVRFDGATGAVNVNLATGVALDGQGGQDTMLNIEGIRATNFDDTLTGGNPANGSGTIDGFEFFVGGGGNDLIDGGAGYDRADYITSTSGATVTLGGTSNGTAQDGLGGTDILISIEAVRGSEFADALTGSDSGTFESFEGRGGNDIIDGRGGYDRVDFSSSIGAVVVSLATGQAQDGYGTTDTLLNIEGVRGSAYADIITGDSGDNTLQGGAGNDTLDGGDGTDTAVFTSNFAANAITTGSGTDILVTGPEGTDTLRSIEVLQFTDRTFAIQLGVAASELITVAGNVDTLVHAREGNDTVAGGSGNDALYGDEGSDSIDGGSGNDLVDGGTGADSMAGGTGDDTYIVDSLLDVVNETLPLGFLKDPLADNPGGGVDTVVSSVNYTLGNFLENLTLASGAGGLSGLGNALANILTGNASNNSLGGAAGNDTIDGSDGVDTATFLGNRSAYALGPLGQATTSVNSAAEGNDTLSHVERLLFADARVAIDTTGAAGHATQLTGAIFGGASIANGALVGQQLAQFDAGLTTEEVAAAALASPGFAAAAGSHSNTAFVNFVYQNVAGVLPDVGTLNLLVGALNSGLYTQASMALLAADYVGLGAVATNGLAYTLQEASVRVGGAGNDTLTGDANANTIFGREGNDVMNGAAGNDLIVGGAGLDRAVFSTTKAASSVTHNDLGLVVTTGTEVDQLEQVERITYSNISVAYDTSGNAGTVAKMIGAMFGIAALQDEALVGQYLAMLDAGTSYEGIVGAAAASTRFGSEAGSHSNAAFVDRVYFNIAGFHPDAATAAPLIAILDNATYTQAQLGVLAAEVDYNVGKVDLTGLAASGLEYTLV